MGLFSKLKSNMDGGVKVRVQVPSAVPSNQVIDVAVNVTSDSTQTINGVKAQIKARAKEEGVSFGGAQGGMGVQESRTMDQVVAQAESREAFTINAGETKTINMQLYLDGNAGSGSTGQMGNMGRVLGGVVQALATQGLEHVNYIYSVHASVDVEGHKLSPGDQQSIQILPPSENTQAPQSPQIDNFQAQPAPPAQPVEEVNPIPEYNQPPNPDSSTPPTVG